MLTAVCVRTASFVYSFYSFEYKWAMEVRTLLSIDACGAMHVHA